MGPGPLVERRCACGAVLAAQSGRARHVVVGHHWRLHWLQGLIGSVAPGDRKTAVSQQFFIRLFTRTKRWPNCFTLTSKHKINRRHFVNCQFLPQSTATSHGWAGGFLCGRVGPGNRPSSSRCVVAMLLEEQSQVKTLLLSPLAASVFPLPVNMIQNKEKLTIGRNRKTTVSYLGLKPLSASRQKGKTENKTCSLVSGLKKCIT